MSTNVFSSEEIEAVARIAIDEQSGADRDYFLGRLGELVKKIELIITTERGHLGDVFEGIEPGNMPAQRISYLRGKIDTILDIYCKQMPIDKAYPDYLLFMQQHKKRPLRLTELHAKPIILEAFTQLKALIKAGLRFKSKGFPGSHVRIQGQNGRPDILGNAVGFINACEVIVVDDEDKKHYAYTRHLSLVVEQS